MRDRDGLRRQDSQREAAIDVGSAGTAARFLAAMLGFSDGCYEIRCSAQMKRRPMAELFELLSGAGAKITFLEEEGHLPVRITGCRSARADETAGETPRRLSLTLRRAHSF